MYKESTFKANFVWMDNEVQKAKTSIATIFFNREQRLTNFTLHTPEEEVKTIGQFRSFGKGGLLIPDRKVFPSEYATGSRQKNFATGVSKDSRRSTPTPISSAKVLKSTPPQGTYLNATVETKNY